MKVVFELYWDNGKMEATIMGYIFSATRADVSPTTRQKHAACGRRLHARLQQAQGGDLFA